MLGLGSMHDKVRDALGEMIVLAAILDPCGKVIAIDPLALDQAGLSQDKVLGAHLAECFWFKFSTSAADALRQDLFRARLGYLAKRETIMRLRDANRQPVLLQCKPHRDAEGFIKEIVVIAVGLSTETAGVNQVQSEIARLTTINRELVHRVKNLFAVVLAALSMSYRQTATREALLEMAQARIAALSKAHLLAVDVTHRQSADSVSLETLVRTVVSPHLPYVDRIKISGPNLGIPLEYLTPLTLILHELSTNSSKYGALSCEDGCLQVFWTERKATSSCFNKNSSISCLVWSEPDASASIPLTPHGFGSKLLQRCADQMKGRVEILRNNGKYQFKLIFDDIS